MGVKQIISDDLTDKTLPSDTKPTGVRVGGEDYEVYLSDESLETFLAFLRGEAPLLAGAKPAKAASSQGGGVSTSGVPRGTKSRYSAAKAEQTEAFKDWAKVNGHDLPAKGAASQEVYDSFFADNDGLPRLIGRGTQSIEDWHAANPE